MDSRWLAEQGADPILPPRLTTLALLTVRRCTASRRRPAALIRAGRVAHRIATLAARGATTATPAARTARKPTAAITAGRLRSAQMAPGIRATDQEKAQALAAQTPMRLAPTVVPGARRARGRRLSLMACRAVGAAGAGAFPQARRGLAHRPALAQRIRCRQVAATRDHRRAAIRGLARPLAARVMPAVRAIADRGPAPPVARDPPPVMRRPRQRPLGLIRAPAPLPVQLARQVRLAPLPPQEARRRRLRHQAPPIAQALRTPRPPR